MEKGWVKHSYGSLTISQSAHNYYVGMFKFKTGENCIRAKIENAKMENQKRTKTLYHLCKKI